MELEIIKPVSSEVSACAGSEVLAMETNGNTDVEKLMRCTTCGTALELLSLEMEEDEGEG